MFMGPLQNAFKWELLRDLRVHLCFFGAIVYGFLLC